VTMMDPMMQEPAIGTLRASLTPAQFEQVVNEATDELVERGRIYYETLTDTSAFKPPSAEERLARYRARDPIVWKVLAQLDPDDYAKSMKDWERLEGRAQEKQQPVRRTPVVAPGRAY
jgi:hypothetical protein